MPRGRLRPLLFEHLILNLAVLLGFGQVLVAHWLLTVVAGGEGFGLASGLGLAVLLVAFNVLAAPRVRNARRGRGWAARGARLYLEFSVAILLLGVAVALVGAVFVPAWGIAQLVGAGSEAVLRVHRWVSLLGVGGLGLLILWGFSVGQALVDRTRVRVQLAGLHPDLDPSRRGDSSAWSSGPTRSIPT
jgi:hypothetical protein